MSPTTRARLTARDTTPQWYSICSMVTGTVVSSPCTAMPAESPTRIRSMPDSSRSSAMRKS